MSGPKRIQLSRKKGWRMPVSAINCARPGRFGNQFKIGITVCHGRGLGFSAKRIMTNADAVSAFEAMLKIPGRAYPADEEIVAALQGRDLACWCHLCDRHRDGKPLDEDCADCAPCHVDPLGKVANAPVSGNIDQVPA